MPMARPQLLFLCQTLPYPPDGGVWIRTYHVLRLLARAFDVTALCFERADSPRTLAGDARQASGDGLRRFAEVEVFPIPQRRSRARYAWDHFRSAALGRAYTEFLYQSRSFDGTLRELLRTRSFDCVHVDSLVDLARYLRVCEPLPAICVHHNIESALLRRRAAIERHPIRRGYMTYQSQLMERLEREWCPRVALNIAVSESDRTSLRSIAPGSRIAVVPNGVDTDEFRPVNGADVGLVYVGGMNWFPNRDALEFFCGDILPHLTRGRRRVPVTWVGAASEQEQRLYRDRHGVGLTGYVDDVRPFVGDAACHIVPLRVGGGTRLKILNAWAMGKAVVSTSIGCEGLAATDGENILVRDEPRAFADAVLAVIEDPLLRRRLGQAGRETAERVYSWERIGAEMIDAYLAARRSAEGAALPDAVTFRAEPRYNVD
jgi:glycosyltransferase involved in cell wall biosynthesis